VTALAAVPETVLDPPRCLVMGVVNVTPDSFSDGGRWLDAQAAIAHGVALVAQGADLVDVGGESTRPGAARVPEAEELRRVIPVIAALRAEGICVSVDTTRARVAEQALAAGAVIVNDVSGGAADPAMVRLVAETGAPFVVMHWRAPSDRMEGRAVYGDVVAEVRAELLTRVETAIAAGVAEARIVIDPGLGFAKNAEHNWALLTQLNAMSSWGFPLLIGASRKRFLGALLAGPTGEPAPPQARDEATAAVTAIAALAGAWAVRVHEVPGSAAAVRVAAAIRAAGGGSGAPAGHVGGAW